MKVAFCFSGAIRYFDRTYPTLKKYVLDNFENADIFMHMWTIDDLDDINYNFKWIKDNSNIEKILTLLKPKDYVIDTFNNEWENIIKKESNINFDIIDNELKDKNYGFNCISMYWKIMKCYELAKNYSIKNNFEYDLIIRIRIDFIWEDHITPSLFLPLKNNVYLIRDKYATLSNKINNDKFFAGNQNIMDNMCNIFKYIHTLYNKNYILDGQIINEAYIKEFNINHTWIGHMNTYYKCMGRHTKLDNYRKNILINIDYDSEFFNNLSYYLLFNGFNVNYKYLKDYNKYIPIYKELNNDNHSLYHYIITLNENILKINNVKFIFNEDLLKYILINNIFYLIDFLISFFKNKNNINIYYFNNIEHINKIKEDELVIYKFKDRGYYKCKYNYYNLNNNKYIILFQNKNINVNRKDFKIFNLLNYYKKNFLPINYF